MNKCIINQTIVTCPDPERGIVISNTISDQRTPEMQVKGVCGWGCGSDERQKVHFLLSTYLTERVLLLQGVSGPHEAHGFGPGGMCVGGRGSDH